MIGFLGDVAQAALLGGCAFVLCRIYVFQLERFADSGCLCHKGAWHPDCPIHGRRA